MLAGEGVLRREQDALGEHGADNGEPVAPPEPGQSLAAHHRAEARRRRPASLASGRRHLQKQPHALEWRDGGLRCSAGEGADGHVRRHRRLLLLLRQHAARQSGWYSKLSRRLPPTGRVRVKFVTPATSNPTQTSCAALCRPGGTADDESRRRAEAAVYGHAHRDLPRRAWAAGSRLRLGRQAQRRRSLQRARARMIGPSRPRRRCAG